LEEQCKLRARDKELLLRQLQSIDQMRPGIPDGHAGNSSARASAGFIDYSAEFDWTQELKQQMKQVFDIDDFRLCQKRWDLTVLSPSYFADIIHLVCAMLIWTVGSLFA
jgi:hypothetical protein